MISGFCKLENSYRRGVPPLSYASPKIFREETPRGHSNNESANGKLMLTEIVAWQNPVGRNKSNAIFIS